MSCWYAKQPFFDDWIVVIYTQPSITNLFAGAYNCTYSSAMLQNWHYSCGNSYGRCLKCWCFFPPIQTLALQTSAAKLRTSVAEVSLFQLAEAPTNMYDYTIPLLVPLKYKLNFETSQKSEFLVYTRLDTPTLNNCYTKHFFLRVKIIYSNGLNKGIPEEWIHLNTGIQLVQWSGHGRDTNIRLNCPIFRCD